MQYALITGASKGIGKAIAEELARRKQLGILMVARSKDLLETQAQALRSQFQIPVDFLDLDLSDPNSPQKIYDWCKAKGYSVSVLVNNAGYGQSGPFLKYGLPEQWEMMQVNMQTPVALTRLFLPDLKNLPQAFVLNIASTAAYQAVPSLTLYAASKAFVLSFSRGLRRELKGTNLSVTCISPGPTNTNFVDRADIGKKGRQAAEKVNMSPEKVASIAIEAMYRRKTEVVPGFLNKLTIAMVWLLPKKLVENIALGFYEE